MHWRILGAILAGTALGLVLGPAAGALGYPSRLVLRLLGAIAPPLILVAICRGLMRTRFTGSNGWRLARLLLLNTLVAIGIGLMVAGVLQPGRWHPMTLATPAPAAGAPTHPLLQLLDNVPRSLLGPLGDDGKILAVIFLAVALGLALRGVRDQRLATVDDLVDLAQHVLGRFLTWTLELVPFAVLGIIAAVVGAGGLGGFAPLGGFVVAVLCGLALQIAWYLLRLRLGSWVRPVHLIANARDALVVAFSTASSTAAMPVNYQCLRHRVGLREESATLGALVGTNFNNDGTALYEAMSALFVAQVLGLDLSLPQQGAVVLTSVAASVGAAGIPEAGLVTMTLVFRAVGLPLEYIAILLSVDWFLDRCRTAVNIMGDMNVSCLLDGKERSQP